MEDDDYTPQSERENAGDWLSRFSAACLRINKSLDFGAVLQEVIDSACWLTGARYGAFATFDDSGDIEHLVTHGITPEERQQLEDLPQGSGLLGHLGEAEEPLRLTDIASHASSVGFPKNHPPMKTFLGSSVRYRNEILGNIYLAEKEGGREFGREDEQILLMFASQAALVIDNARRRREELRVKADLEALLNLSPVGVLVYDAKTRHLVSANYETTRIVGKLNAVGLTQSQIIEMVTLRTPDGRRITLDELPSAKAMNSGETVLADEVVVHLQDGRTVTTLMSARPIYREGEIVSVVATIQDITPLEEMRRQRTEFLGRVNHELRTPLTSIKGSVASMLGSFNTLDAAEARQYLRIIDEQAEQMRVLIDDFVDVTQIEAGTLSVALEPTDLERLVEQARDAFLRRGAANDIRLDLPPDLPRVMADGQRISQVLGDFLREAADSSPEPSPILVSVSPDELYVTVLVEAQGTGPSAGEEARSRRGRSGLNLAICKGIVEAHGGRMSVEGSGPGHRARFSLTIPVADEIAFKVGRDSAELDSPPQQPVRDRGRILAVDGDPEARRHIRSTLSEAGFTPVITGNPDELEYLIEMEKPHLVLAEPAFPWDDGFELMERIRRVSDVPVIFLSGHGSGQHMERAFELGAADYIVKPFTATELVTRTRAALRRREAPAPNGSPEPFVLGDLNIDYAERLVTIGGRRAELTATEYNLLVELSMAAGRVLTHEQLLRSVWGPLYASDAQIVHTYVKQVRRKLGDRARSPTYIFTVPRVGYRMARPESL